MGPRRSSAVRWERVRACAGVRAHTEKGTSGDASVARRAWAHTRHLVQLSQHSIQALAGQVLVYLRKLLHSLQAQWCKGGVSGHSSGAYSRPVFGHRSTYSVDLVGVALVMAQVVHTHGSLINARLQGVILIRLRGGKCSSGAKGARIRCCAMCVGDLGLRQQLSG